MWLVVGLGNPGGKYEHNRHNIGFRTVDELARKHALPAWRSGSKEGGDVTSGVISSTATGQHKAVLLKPMGFMNLSGFAVQRTSAGLGLAVTEILVVHDDIDLEFGIVRLKSGGGHGGHNGLRSIIEQLGEPGFARLRIGVGRDPHGPPGSKDAARWVLSDFSRSQHKALTAVIAAGCEDIEAVLETGLGAAMNQHNGRPNLATP